MSIVAKQSPISATAELLFNDHAQEFMLHNNGIGTYDEVFNGERERNWLLSADVFLYASNWCNVCFEN